MNFFKSVFSDDPDPPESAQPESPSKDALPLRGEEADEEPGHPSSSRWGGLGGLVKTLTTKSESVLETYRRDLQEFGLGLRKEIQVAHGSLENVGQAIDELGSSVLKGTTQIISQGKEAILAADLNSDPTDQGHTIVGNSSQSYRRYSRLDAQVRAIQGDVGTFSEEPEDSGDYSGWKLGFHLGEKREEIEKLMEEDGPVRGFYYRLVPGSIDGDTFWCRYFYRVCKLEQAENVRASLVKRAISSEEEELTWDVYDENDDDDDVNGEKEVKKASRLSNMVSAEAVQMDNDEDGNLGEAVKKEKDSSSKKEMESASGVGSLESKDAYGKETDDRTDGKMGKSGSELHQMESNIEESEEQNEENQGGDSQLSPTPSIVDEKTKNVGSEDSSKGVSLIPKDRNAPQEDVHLQKVSDVNTRNSSSGSQENLASNVKVEPGKSKESNPAAALSNPSPTEEEDLGWDEIEDLSGIDDQTVAPGGTSSTNRADLRKRLSVAEEEEDLTWDIEDDGEPAKA